MGVWGDLKSGVKRGLGYTADAMDPLGLVHDGGIQNLNPFDTKNIPGQPGVPVAPAKDPSLLQRDPVTGAYFDPTTGTSYMDPSGTQPVTNPNLAQQTASNFATRQAFLNKIQGQESTLDAVNHKQDVLGGSLQNTISNVNAPSVAAVQQQQQVDANGRAILGTAAGVGGNNAYDARRTAINALAGADTAAAGNAALLRAKEVEAAQGNLGTILNQQGGAAQKRLDTNATIASDAGKTAATAEGNIEKNALDAAKANKEEDERSRDKGLGALAKLGGMAGI